MEGLQGLNFSFPLGRFCLWRESEVPVRVVRSGLDHHGHARLVLRVAVLSQAVGEKRKLVGALGRLSSVSPCGLGACDVMRAF